MKITVEVLMVYLPDTARCDSEQMAWPGVFLRRWHGNHSKHTFTEVMKRILGRVSAVSRGWMEEGGRLFLMHLTLETQDSSEARVAVGFDCRELFPLCPDHMDDQFQELFPLCLDHMISSKSSFHCTQTTWMINSPLICFWVS